MGINRKKRWAIHSAGLPFVPIPPEASGSIDAGDRATLMGIYWDKGLRSGGTSISPRTYLTNISKRK